MNIKILGITTIVLLAFLSVVFYLATFDDANTETIELSDNSTLKITSEEPFDKFEIVEENNEGKEVYTENSWIHFEPIRNEQELREIGTGYSKLFGRENLGCNIYPDEGDLPLGASCFDSFDTEDSYNMLRVVSGYSYDDAIPSVFDDKNQLKRNNFEIRTVTLYKHCQWDRNIMVIGEIYEFVC